jgi:hypothetical protein
MQSTIDSDVRIRQTPRSGWVGWVVFGAVTLIVTGSFSVIWGVVALVKDRVFVAGPGGNVISWDYTTWGWIHLAIGVIAVLTGLALFTGALWASIVAITIAVGSATANLLVLGSFPVWSVIVITLDVLVIYAITVHGDELDPDY